MNILPLLDRPIAFQRSFIRLEMGVTAALFLSQLTYWTNRTTDDGWVYKTQDEWEENRAFTIRAGGRAQKTTWSRRLAGT